MALNLKKCLSPVSLVLCDIYSQPTNAFALEKKKTHAHEGAKKMLGHGQQKKELKLFLMN